MMGNSRIFVLLSVALVGAVPPDSLDPILSRMDQNALTFKSMRAKLRHLS